MTEYQLRKEYAKWSMSFDWNIFGTLSFAANKKPSLLDAERHWSRFWNKIDVLCFDRTRKHQARMPRFVVAHSGANGDNHHIHFLAKAEGDVSQVCVLMNALWAGLEHAGAAIPEQNEILPLFSNRHASWYLFHEGVSGESGGFNAKLSYLPADISSFRSDGLNRLRNAADRGTHLHDAEAAIETHLVRAQRRYIQRNSQ